METKILGGLSCYQIISDKGADLKGLMNVVLVLEEQFSEF